MVFIHDTRLALDAAVDLVNTSPAASSEGEDGLTAVADSSAPPMSSQLCAASGTVSTHCGWSTATTPFRS
jgi:hypothetical protein